MDGDALDGRPEMPRHRVRPADPQPHIGRAERRHVHARAGEDRPPCRIRPQTRPARPAQRQNGDVGADAAAAIRRLEPKFRPVRVEPGPAPSGPQIDPRIAQPRQPRAQQRRGLHADRKDAAGRAGEQLGPQALRPGHDLSRTESGQGAGQMRAIGAGRELGRKAFHRFRAGQVQARFPGHQEFAGRGRHRLGQDDATPGGGQHLGRHQPGRTRADDQRVNGVGHRRPRGIMDSRISARSISAICGARVDDRSARSVSINV